MRTPKESLEDFTTGRIADPKPTNPPPVRVVLHPSGRVEVLKPVALSEDFAQHPAAVAAPLVSSVSGEAILASWGRRSMAFAGAFAVILLVFAAGLLIGLNYRPAEPLGTPGDLALDQQLEKDLTSTDPDVIAPLTSTTSAPISDQPIAKRSVVNPSSARQRVLRPVYRSRSIARVPKITLTGFVPTTLVIYVEKGEIRSRIEPQLSSN
jgi:hypothetical protein